jgi:hypothetical protein
VARLDLSAIEASLRAVQRDFDRINHQLSSPRDPLSDDVVERMMAGYVQVDRLLAERVDPFARGNSGAFLELNFLVMCGVDRRQREECKSVMKATEKRYYKKSVGSFEALAEHLALMDGQSVWRRAAAAYIHVLSEPQLFIEGNHRTGSLIMSWMLANEGRPPFVLSVANAKAFFDPSTVTKSTRKRSMHMMLTRPKLLKRFAKLVREDASKDLLLS